MSKKTIAIVTGASGGLGLEFVKILMKKAELERCKIKYLINNAGFAKCCSYEDLSLDESINMIDLNNTSSKSYDESMGNTARSLGCKSEELLEI